ncbi:MAG TPA: hypothetical protein VHY82_07610 [Acetobacteraceae bacterium]|jgi:uncharacterized lipoprotein|nr:hypothetical protein [Acetobacteraceae bacterium]
MRYLVLLAIAMLAGCGSSPRSLGITGPGAAPAEAPGANDSVVPPPGISNPEGSYRYNVGPLQSGGDRYFDYN